MKSGDKYTLVMPLRLYDFGDKGRDKERQIERDSRVRREER
jgi:hypothetical protein